MRDALHGVTRFSDFRDRLRVASDILTQRLGVLVDAGIMEKHQYREEGARARMDYRLTPAGRELIVVIGALQQWGDHYRPHPDGPAVRGGSKTTGRPVRVAFVDDEGHEVPLTDVSLIIPIDAPQLVDGHQVDRG